MKITNTEYFDIRRKIVSNMTSESWRSVPHVTYMYEPDVTEILRQLRQSNMSDSCRHVSVNTLTLKLISESLKAAPGMNAHISFDKNLVRGKIDTFENIDISMPMVMPDGGMMTVNLHDFGNKNLSEMTDYISDIRRRSKNTVLEEAMYEVSINDTVKGLKKGKLLKAILRLVGSKTGRHRVKTLAGKEKKSYEAIPRTERLTADDLVQGTVTVSNIGSIYRGQGAVSLLEIVPPQVCAFGVGAVTDKPVVVTDELGRKSIEIRQVLPICIAFDHRALDFGEIVPFMQCFDELSSRPGLVGSWLSGDKRSEESVA